MSLPFNRNTPQGTDVVAATQTPILNNFQSIDSVLNGPTGSASGGGNFTTYNIQNTTPNFPAKPINPIGSLYTVASTPGNNPELAWINGVNAQGAGPFTGTQITGGGITAAAWGFMLGGTGALVAGYNCTTVRNSVGNYTIFFTRPFSSANYAPIITPYIAINAHIGIASQNPSSFNFVTFAPTNPTDSAQIGFVFFGYLV